MPSPHPTPSPETASSRRTIVKGAAWSVPVLAAAGAAPAQALSCDTTTFQAPSTTTAARAVTNWTVPAGVTLIEYVVEGGAGGGRSAGSFQGGAGARVSGALTVVPGTVLQLIVGAGGLHDDGINGGSNAGGGGYGAGGASGAIPPLAGSDRYRAGSGGGGSAILVGAGGPPVVVAGGGGGSGDGIYGPAAGSFTDIGDEVDVNNPGHGASGSTDAPTAGQVWDPPAPAASWSVTAPGGRGGTASGGGGGLDLDGTATTPFRSLALGSTTTGPGVFGGSAASGQNVTGGGVGAAGGAGGWTRYTAFTAGGNSISQGGTAAGGGGGGYTGGGGGASTAATWTSGSGGIPITNAVLAIGAGGGGGGSFISSVAVGAVTPWPGTVAVGTNTNSTAGVRRPGSITLTYCAPTN